MLIVTARYHALKKITEEKYKQNQIYISREKDRLSFWEMVRRLFR